MAFTSDIVVRIDNFIFKFYSDLNYNSIWSWFNLILTEYHRAISTEYIDRYQIQIILTDIYFMSSLVLVDCSYDKLHDLYSHIFVMNIYCMICSPRIYIRNYKLRLEIKMMLDIKIIIFLNY